MTRLSLRKSFHIFVAVIFIAGSVFVANVSLAQLSVPTSPQSIYYNPAYTIQGPLYEYLLTGTAQSDNLGSISMSGIANDGTPYGVMIQGGRYLKGIAWSSLAGWISFNYGCPSAFPTQPCAPRTTGNVDAAGNGVNIMGVEGWARATVGDPHVNIPGPWPWDGWIHLSGTADDGMGYGVVLTIDHSLDQGTFSGNAYDGQGGYINFSGVTVNLPSDPVQLMFTNNPNPIVGEAFTLEWYVDGFPSYNTCTLVSHPVSTPQNKTFVIGINNASAIQQGSRDFPNGLTVDTVFTLTCEMPGNIFRDTVTVDVDAYNPTIGVIDFVPNGCFLVGPVTIGWTLTGAKSGTCHHYLRDANGVETEITSGITFASGIGFAGTISGQPPSSTYVGDSVIVRCQNVSVGTQGPANFTNVDAAHPIGYLIPGHANACPQQHVRPWFREF